MPIRAKLFAYMIAAAGGVTLAFAALLWTCQSPLRFLTCWCLTLLASTFKVKLPGMEGCISPSLVPLLFAAGTMSWQESMVLATAAGVTQSLWKARKPPQLIQVLFNGANLTISLGLGFAIAHTVAPNQLLVQLGVAAIVYELINTLTVSTIIRLVTGAPLAGVWRNCHLWTFPYHLAGAVTAALWIQTGVAMGASVTVLCAVVLYSMSTFYQELVTRTGPAEPAASVTC